MATKIIDIHRHLWGYDWFPPSHLPKFSAEAIARRTNRSVGEVMERIKQSPTMDATSHLFLPANEAIRSLSRDEAAASVQPVSSSMT